MDLLTNSLCCEINCQLSCEACNGKWCSPCWNYRLEKRENGEIHPGRLHVTDSISLDKQHTTLLCKYTNRKVCYTHYPDRCHVQICTHYET